MSVLSAKSDIVQKTGNEATAEDPLSGLMTTTGILPWSVIKYPGTFTVIVEEVTVVGNKIVLPKLTYAMFGLVSKFEPFIVRVNGTFSPGAVGGLNELMIGAAGCWYELTPKVPV